MNGAILLVAAILGAGILLIFLGLAGSGGGSGVSQRLERYASGKEQVPTAQAGGASFSDVLAQSVALARLNKSSSSATSAPTWRATSPEPTSSSSPASS